ncbi:MAG TPA: hypothetical protein VE175_07470 [Woeseiaceae bacterium]|nr:hypothetical protein [Woeseiaceae bacterium]
MEASDLGVRLCQSAAGSVYRCWLAVALPLMVLMLAAGELAVWIPTLGIWMAKPWLDRTILFALSRAAFGGKTLPRDVWAAQRHVWWAQLLRTWTLRRLSPWRSLTGPVYQLEGLAGSPQRQRARQIRSGKAGAGMLVTSAFGLAELALIAAIVALADMFAPAGMDLTVDTFFDPAFGRVIQFAFSILYAVVVAFLEPFYVAAGFGLYLNRRVELEAWDVEQELKRAQPR